MILKLAQTQQVALDVEGPVVHRRVAAGVDIHPLRPHRREDVEAPPQLRHGGLPNLLERAVDGQVVRRVTDHREAVLLEGAADTFHVHKPRGGGRRFEREVGEAVAERGEGVDLRDGVPLRVVHRADQH